MKIEELLEDTQAIISRVEETIGKDIHFVLDSSLGDQVGLQYALDQGQPPVVTFGPQCGAAQSHLFASKALQIQRMEIVSFEDRRLPVSMGSHMNNAKLQITGEGQNNPVLAEALGKEEILRSWVFSLVNQVVSQPMDIAIQREIYQNCPGLRDQQKDMLEQQMAEFRKTLTGEVQRFSPKVVYDASVVMNGVYLGFLDEITGYGYLDRLEGLTKKRRIQSLMEETRSLLGADHEADRQVTDLWSKTLRIASWFQWYPISELPRQ